MDRNSGTIIYIVVFVRSLSARRAWIEIMYGALPAKIKTVALRKESVDRNAHRLFFVLPRMVSLSARRAWIEIKGVKRPTVEFSVALRKESVDRNSDGFACLKLLVSRSPQGERG